MNEIIVGVYAYGNLINEVNKHKKCFINYIYER